jgi:hypothetical protein
VSDEDSSVTSYLNAKNAEVAEADRPPLSLRSVYKTNALVDELDFDLMGNDPGLPAFIQKPTNSLFSAFAIVEC